MKRQEILQQYQVSELGIITSCGKFESEPLYSVYFWDLVMNGDGETVMQGDSIFSVFDITEEDLKEFPELKNTKQIAMYETTQGFVCSWLDPDLSDLVLEDEEEPWYYDHESDISSMLIFVE